jgi:hypothetical protein
MSNAIRDAVRFIEVPLGFGKDALVAQDFGMGGRILRFEDLLGTGGQPTSLALVARGAVASEHRSGYRTFDMPSIVAAHCSTLGPRTDSTEHVKSQCQRFPKMYSMIGLACKVERIFVEIIVALTFATASGELGAEVLWYGGDATGGGFINNTETRIDVFYVLSNFIIPNNEHWHITGLFSNNLSGTGASLYAPFEQARWSIRRDVSTQNSGNVLFSGLSPATQKLTGRTFFPSHDPEINVAVSDLSFDLGPGNYYMGVSPVTATDAAYYVAVGVQANRIGTPGAGGTYQEWFSPEVTDVVHRIVYYGPYAASMGVIGSVINLTPTMTIVTSSANPSLTSQPVTFTATVTGGPTPTGTITFTEEFPAGSMHTLCSTVALDASGQAICSYGPPFGGSHIITATYAGDATHASSSGTLMQNVVAMIMATNAIPTLSQWALGSLVFLVSALAVWRHNRAQRRLALLPNAFEGTRRGAWSTWCALVAARPSTWSR